jgi:hypothetical protein
MAKDIVDLLCDNVAWIHNILFQLVKTVATHGVWIKILSTLLIGALHARNRSGQRLVRSGA